MSRPNWVLILPLAFALAGWEAGCGGPPSRGGGSCSSDEECRADARCSSGSCVANSPPVAEFAVDGDLQAAAIVTLDGSASRDPDRGDAITSYFWTIEPDGASCEGPVVASSDPVVQVRFGCAGQFRAQLIVLDGKLVESVPATRSIAIQPRSAPAMVQAGPDQTVGHLCSGSPLTCRLRSTVQLTATMATQAPVTFRWSVQPPPGRELDAHHQVRFVPDASAQNPTVEIETDGAAISGDWQLRIEVRDGLGVLDSDVTRVSVTNHPPVIRGGPAGAFAHAFDASSLVFTSGGTFPAIAEDEDGDPIVRKVEFHHAGDGGAAFVGEDLGGSVRFTVAVPYDVPADALLLRGGTGLDRSVALTATDPNGGAATTTFNLEIGDRPPVMVASGETSAPHSYDVSARLFRAQPAIGRWSDPDGDPLTYAVTADSECPTFAVLVDGTVKLACARSFSTMGSLAGFLRARKASVVVADPWTSITSPSTFRIGNRVPAISLQPFKPDVECKFRDVTGPWCPGTGSGLERANLFPAALLSAPSGVTDPDGDPVEVKPSGGAAMQCLPGQPCTLPVLKPETVSCDFWPPDFDVPFTASDGVGSSSGSVHVDPSCR